MNTQISYKNLLKNSNLGENEPKINYKDCLFKIIDMINEEYQYAKEVFDIIECINEYKLKKFNKDEIMNMFVYYFDISCHQGGYEIFIFGEINDNYFTIKYYTNIGFLMQGCNTIFFDKFERNELIENLMIDKELKPKLIYECEKYKNIKELSEKLELNMDFL